MRERDGYSGVEELRDAAAAVGLTAESPSAAAADDLVLIGPDGDRFMVRVKRLSLLSGDSVERQIASWEAGLVGDPGIRVLVADRVTVQARKLLRASGLSWLDLRGHLHLVGKGLFVDAEVPQLRAEPRPSKALAGRVSQEVAALLLLDPSRPASVREISRTLQRSASSVSQAIVSMRQSSLVDGFRKPAVPELFWELAERWQLDSKDLHRPIAHADGAFEALRLGLDNVETTVGWALTDTMAAVAFGAPIGVRADHPPDFFVPDQAAMRRAVNLLGIAPNRESRTMSVRVAPFPLICARRIHQSNETWPLARPLFVALDLAQDPGRGHEVLNGWTPPAEAGPRVW